MAMSRIVPVLLVVSALNQLSVPATANEWPEHHRARLMCAKLRATAHDLVAGLSSQLWYSSTDNSPDGWVNPAVVAASSADITQYTVKFERDLLNIKVEGAERVPACRAVAFNFASQAGAVIQYVLEHGTRPHPWVADNEPFP
jgi:hypothetical protein